MPTPAERFDAARNAAKAIQATAAKENRDLTAEESAQIVAHGQAATAAKAEIDAAKKASDDALAALSTIDGADADLAKSRGRRVPSATTPAAPAVARETFLDDPKRGYQTPRAFLSDVLAVGTGRQSAIAKPENLKSLWVPDNGMQATVGSDEQGGYANPYGGFAIPTGLVPGLMTRGFDGDPFGSLVTPLPMSSPFVKVNARTDHDHSSSFSGGLTVTRRPETVAGTSSRMQIEQIEFKATSLFGLAYATEEILRDSPISFAALLEQGFRDEFVATKTNERLHGTGAGEFEGVVTAPCTISVTKETSQVAATIVTANLLKMMARCWGYASAVWYANPTCIPQLALLTIDVGTGGVPVFMPSLREGVPATLLGRPIYFGEFAKAVGTVGDIVLGNWSQFLEGTYEPMQGASSVHVRFVNHEQTFKFWERNCGRPWWRAALTPKNGSTLSPFVTLATRS